ncbi:MAG: hypothetical protein V9E83_06570 [Baekduia sp.]
MLTTEHDLGVTWTVDDEGMARSWHVVALEGGVWIIDPVDCAGTIEAATSRGTVRGVIQLLDRHQRSNRAIADQLGVPHHRLPDELPDTPFTVETPLDKPGWRERALWIAGRRALIVAEVVGAGPQYLVGPGRVGVHPMLRLKPPGRLSRFADAEHLLMGHGPPLSGPDAGTELVAALDRTRRDIVRMPAAMLRMPKPFRRGRLD